MDFWGMSWIQTAALQAGQAGVERWPVHKSRLIIWWWPAVGRTRFSLAHVLRGATAPAGPILLRSAPDLSKSAAMMTWGCWHFLQTLLLVAGCWVKTYKRELRPPRSSLLGFYCYRFLAKWEGIERSTFEWQPWRKCSRSLWFIPQIVLIVADT